MSERLYSLYNIFKSSPHGAWVVGFDDYLALTKLISDHKINNVLELGTGIGASAAVMSLAGARVTTVEHFEKCIDIAKDLIPQDLQKRIDFVEIKSEVINPLPYICLQRFKKLPDGDYDLVVIDGPGPYLDKNGFLVDLPGGDFIELIHRTKEGTLFYVDGRKKMVGIIRRFFSRYFELLEDNSASSILRRSAYPAPAEGEVKIFDVYLENYKQFGYL